MNNAADIYKECINFNEGKCLVLAGPGTGKTDTIKKRIIHLVNELHVNPEEILCLTFTKTGAEEMARRFEEQDIFGVDVFTFHSFCSSVIEAEPSYFNLPANYKLISDSTKFTIVKECLDKLGANVQRTLPDSMAVFEKIKRTRITEEQFLHNLATNPDWDINLCKPGKEVDALKKRIEKTNLFWQVYQLYCDKTKQKGLIDFSDLINSVLDRLANDPEFLIEVSQKYRYLLVDEYQDTNEPQNELVIRLGKAIGNVFVVGDDDQMIYGFQGASSKTMGDFLRQFPDAKVFCLTTNYRSNQKILDYAELVASQDSSRMANSTEFSSYNISKKLTSMKDAELKGEILLTRYGSAEQERHKTVLSVKRLVSSGISNLNEIAVIVSKNDEAKAYSSLMDQVGIPSQTSSGCSIFSIHAVSVLMHYLQALSDPCYYSGSLLMSLRAKPFEFTPEEFVKARSAVNLKQNAIEALRNLCTEENVKIKEFLRTYDYLQDYRAGESLHNTILEVAGKTGILKYFTEDNVINKTKSIAGIKKLIEIADDFANVRNDQSIELFLNHVNELVSTGKDIFIDSASISLNAVQIMTYHSVKGLQFEYVFMPGLESVSFESSKKSYKDIFPFTDSAANSPKTEKKNDCIRRLFVGITRTKRSLYMSYSKTLTSIISSINDPNLVSTTEVEDYGSADEYWNEQLIDLAKAEFDYEKEFKDYLESQIASKDHYSPTELNNYIACPRHYYLDRILSLKGDVTDCDSASYGTAIHASFEYAMKYKTETGNYPSESDINKVFQDSMDALEMSSFDVRYNFVEKGKNSISSFLQFMVNNMSTHETVGTEENFDLTFDEKKFIGFIDRIDKDSSGQYWIYDYKTGKPKKAKDVQIGGEHENYYRQLGVYKYAYEKLHPEAVDVRTALLFPDAESQEECILEIRYTPEETEKIADDYKKAIERINQLKFEQCSESDSEIACKFCPFKKYFCNR